MGISKYNASGCLDFVAKEAIDNAMREEKYSCITKPRGKRKMSWRNENKYKNIKVELDDIVFESKAEARRYEELKLLKQAGEILDFGIQPSFVLSPKVRYRPDFIVGGKNGEVWVEDVKGFETEAFRIKKKLWDSKFGSWLPLRIIK